MHDYIYTYDTFINITLLLLSKKNLNYSINTFIIAEDYEYFLYIVCNL